MTRVDVIEEAYVNNIFKVIKWAEGDYEFDFEPVREFLNELYDDVESRVCKNCKRFKNEWCSILEGASAKYTLDYLDENNFGCNRFRKKEIK